MRRWTVLPEAYHCAKGQNFAQSFQTMADIGFPPEIRRVKKKHPGAWSEH
jgi:hypothetical protein